MLLFYLLLLRDDNERDIFTEIYEQHKSRMVRIAGRILRSEELAEEASHEAFLAIIDNFDKVMNMDEEGKARWISVVTRNRALNILKKERRSIPVYEDFWFDNIQAQQKDEDFSFVTEAIQSLPEKYREVLELFYIEGYSAKEVSSILGISVDNVSQRARRGKKMLKELLEKQDIWE